MTNPKKEQLFDAEIPKTYLDCQELVIQFNILFSKLSTKFAYGGNKSHIKITV